MSISQSIEKNVTSSGASRGLGLLLVLTLAVFWRGIGGKFVTWDDEPLIYTNPNISNPTLGGLAWHWRHPHNFLYIPVIYSTWWSIARLEVPERKPNMPLDPAPFHLANLVLHLGSVSIVFWLVRWIVGNAWAAVAGAAIFAVHPLQVEAVAWATGMKDVLGGFLSFAAIALYLWREDRHEGEEEQSWDWRWWTATILFVLALLAKPSAVMVPGIVLVPEYLVERRSVKSILLRLWSWFVLAGVWVVVTKQVQPAVAIEAGPWWARPWVAADAIGFYLAKIAWPVNLGIDYGRTPGWLIANRSFWGVAVTAAAGLTVVLIRVRDVAAASIVFVLAMLPVLGFVAFDFQSQSTVADRYVYVAMLGPAIVVALAAKAMPRRMAIGACLAVVAVWSILSFQQIGVWRDSQTLYLHALQVNPRSLTAAQDVAIVYDKSGDELSAINYYVRAMEIEPRAREEYDNLAMAMPRAEKQWPGLTDRWAELHERLARFYEAIGDSDAARAQRAAADGLGR
jgi:hypothetical protein